MRPLELPKDAEVVVLDQASQAVPARLLFFSETEFTIASPLNAPVNTPIRVSGNTYILLGEVLEVQAAGDSRVTRALLHHYIDLTAASEAAAYWS